MNHTLRRLLLDREVIATLMDKWINDPLFREEVRRDPEAAVRRLGLTLSSADWEVLRGMGWELPDGELRNRLSR